VQQHTDAQVESQAAVDQHTKIQDDAEKIIEKNAKSISSLTAQYEHEVDAGTAKGIKDEIDALRAESEAETKKRNEADVEKGKAQGKLDFHKAELKRLNVAVPPSSQEIERALSKKLNAQHKKVVDKLHDHIEFNAMQAKNLAFQNKMLLDKISEHTDMAATAIEIQKVSKSLQDKKGELVTAKQESESTNPQVASQAVEKVRALEGQITGLEAEKAALEKPVSEEEDPIMALTPGARTAVLQEREKIKTQKVAMEDKVAKYEEDLKNLQNTITTKEEEIAQEKDASKLIDLDKALKEWKLAEVTMREDHSKTLAVEQSKLDAYEKGERDMLVGNPANPSAGGMSASDDIKTAEEDLKKTKEASKQVNVAIASLEQAETVYASTRAQMVQLDDEIGNTQRKHAEEPSSFKARQLETQIQEFQQSKDELAKKLKEAKNNLSDAKELSNKRQQHMMFTEQETEQNVKKLDAEKDDAPDKLDFETVEGAVQEIMAQLNDVQASTAEDVEEYNKKAEEAQAAADAASKAVDDALANAEAANNKLSALKAKMNTETEPEALTALKAQVAEAEKAESEAAGKLEAAEAAERAQITAVLKVDKTTVAEKEEALKNLMTQIKVAQQTLSSKEEEQQQIIKDFGNSEDATATEKKQAINKAVEDARNALNDLNAKKQAYKAAAGEAAVREEEEQAKDKEAIAENKEATAEETAKKDSLSALEATAIAKSAEAENTELKKRLAELEKKMGPDKEAIAKKSAEAAEHMKEEMESKEAAVELEHAAESEKHAADKASRLKTLINEDTTRLTKMKIRVRKLGVIATAIKEDKATAQSLQRNIKQESVEEKQNVMTLRRHVADEHDAEKQQQKYKKLLDDANDRRAASLKAQRDRLERHEEMAEKKEAAKTLLDRKDVEKEAQDAEDQAKRNRDDIERKLYEMQAASAAPADIAAQEEKLSDANKHFTKVQTATKVKKFQTEKAQIERIRIDTVDPIKNAKETHRLIQLQLADKRKAVERFTAQLARLHGEKGELEKKLTAATNPKEKLSLQVQLAKNKGLAEAAEVNQEDAKKVVASVDIKNTEQMTKITELQDRERALLKTAPPEVQAAIADHKISSEKASSEAEADDAKAKADAAAKSLREQSIANTVQKEKDSAVDKTVEKLTAKAKEDADAAKLPAPPPSPPKTWQWHGPEPSDGVKPAIPATDPTAELEQAARQSKANLAAAALAETQKAKLDDEADKADVSKLNSELDSAKNIETKQKASEEAALASTDANLQKSKSTLAKDEADKAAAQLATTQANNDHWKTAKSAATAAIGEKHKGDSSAPALLDNAVQFIQKFVWNGVVPPTGKPEVPKYLKVAAGDVGKKKKTVAPPMMKSFGPTAEASQEKSDAEKALQRKTVEVTELREQVMINEKQMKVSPEDASALQEKLHRLKAAYAHAKEEMRVAQQVVQNDKMNLEEVKVGAGEEDPIEAVNKVKLEKEAMARQTLAAARAKVKELNGQKNEYLAKRTATMQDERKMEKIEKESKSPAVKGAAREMEAKENTQELTDMEEAQAADRKAKLAAEKQKREQAEEAKDAEGTDEAAEGAKLEAKKAKDAAKKIMDFEGAKYDKAVKDSAEAQISAAKVNGLWNHLYKQAQTTSSLDKRKMLKAKVLRLKSTEQGLEQQIQLDKETADIATMQQHRVAKDLDKTLAAQVAKAIAGKSSGQTEAEQTAVENQKIAAVEANTESEELSAVREEVVRLQKRLANLATQRHRDEENARIKKTQQKSVKKNPVPEVSKGVKKDAPKEVKAIERAKEASLARDIEWAVQDAKDTAREQVEVALQLEKLKSRVSELERKAKLLSRKASNSAQQVVQAEQKAAQQKYGAEAVLKKAEEKSAESDAKQVQDKALKKAEENVSPQSDEAEDEEEAVKVNGIDAKIKKEKSAVSDIQGKLKLLKSKISAPLLESVEAKGSSPEGEKTTPPK